MKRWRAKDPIGNFIGGRELPAASGELFDKLDPATGEVMARIARSGAVDANAAVAAAKAAQPAWAATPPVQRGMILHEMVKLLQARAHEVSEIVAAETGMSPNQAKGEVGGAAALGLFYASEGQRLYGRTTTSGTENKSAMTIRRPIGVAGLIIAANTPIANVAWKVFPALICGNTAVLKAAEDTPATAWIFGQIAKQAGLPDGVLNVLQGLGPEAGEPVVTNPDVGVLSFTGSSAVGKRIHQLAGQRLARVSLELGGKNPLVVCDDADLESAVKWTILSAFSNAGQRCASGSRIIIFDAVYDQFKAMLLEATAKLRVGPNNGDDLGPVINEKQLANMLDSVKGAAARGADILCGGRRATVSGFENGSFMVPTLLGNVPASDPLARSELFGPIAALWRVPDFAAAVELANDCDYGLTACIHTASIHRAWRFAEAVRTGVAVINAGTYGSEPHMPFGGRGLSGNGSREPGTEALDVYSELQDVYLNIDPAKL